MALSDRLVHIRKDRKMSQLELATKVGLHTNAIGRYERGEAIPSVEVAANIAKALETSLDYLSGLTDLDVNGVTLKRIEDIDSLSDEDRDHVFKVVDSLVRDHKANQTKK